MPTVMELYKLLPKTNCKKCGESTCMAFAVALLSRKKKVSECTPIIEEMFKKDREKLESLLLPSSGAGETGMIVHTELCTGCSNCVVACPVDVANDPRGAGTGGAPTNDKVIFRVVDGKVVASNIKECRRFGKNRVLCYACIDPCPTGAIEFV
ncbi:MAG: 4Fe-4S binding protein [Candidatus Methanoperedens sp.]|nr:4Fe-4S binding protein [Candidatus Methanoperedens sp.]MCZ7360883.1 4Fe-4S binding protein [Candidatus Methanoperedens sp.]HLB70264.1 (Fe-S)-binding protein [Candidatus Methanoperedens sp.]